MRTLRLTRAQAATVDEPWCASVLGGASIALPRGAVIAIGRGRDCELRIDDPLVSRRHARLIGGEPPAIEELGSANATTLVRGAAVEQLVPGHRTPLGCGDVIQVGSVLVGIHRTGSPVTRLVDPAGFEARLAAACARAGGAAVVQIQLAPATRELVARAALFGLADVAGGVVCGVLAAHELTLLLELPADALERELRHLAAHLGELGLVGEIGHAVHGRDGRTAPALLATASAAIATLRSWAPSVARGALAGAAIGVPATRFIGRSEELEELRRRFVGGARLVAVCGAPGTGKSRLALRYAELAGKRGVVCALSGATDEASLIAAVARAFELPADRDAIVRAIAAEPLVIFDDAEGVRAPLTELVARALAVAPQTALLVTSRDRLAAVPSLELAALPLPTSDHDLTGDAACLLLDRAHLAADRLSHERARELVALVRALDGLPLALELAAGWLDVFGPAELLARFEADSANLFDRSAPKHGRHRSLHAAFEPSWARLGDRERAVVRACAALPDGFTHEALAGDVAGAVGALRDAGWLIARGVDGRGRRRFGMSRTARAFVTAQGSTAPRLVILRDARTLVLPTGACIDLDRHASLRRLVLALARRHGERAATGLTTNELLAAGWPGERVDPFSGSARVRVALSKLRRLGLRDLLVRTEAGYVLSEAVAVELDPDP